MMEAKATVSVNLGYFGLEVRRCHGGTSRLVQIDRLGELLNGLFVRLFSEVATAAFFQHRDFIFELFNCFVSF